ncbi:MAG: FAD-dependent oxidoreductase [Mollicutes bacterium]|nr:MAG: FAD-dependent oxidoreductase [Mollicutes bacterium]
MIENFPSVKKTTGAKLAVNFQEQIRYLQIEVITEVVINLRPQSDGTFLVQTSEHTYRFQKVIIATGTREKKMPLAGFERLEGRGVSYCSSCDGYFFKGQTIAVVGSGNSALEETKALAEIAKQVYIINREKTFQAQGILIRDVEKLPNVQIMHHHIVQTIEGQARLSGVVLQDTITQKTTSLSLQGLFIYIGSLPNTSFIKSSLQILDKEGYIVTDQHFMTDITGLYAIGDVVSDYIQQYTTAVSSATIALNHIIKSR